MKMSLKIKLPKEKGLMTFSSKINRVVFLMKLISFN